MELVLPDYHNSIVNLTTSLLRKFGLAADHSSLHDLDQALAHNYKNIVFLILDGMGSSFLLRQLPPESFLRSHYQRNITSVYPCTTAAATTTLQSGLTPAEHGWLGWNAWFMEYGAIIDLFLDRNSLSGDDVSPSPANRYLKYRSIIERIKDSGLPEFKCHYVMPPFAVNGVDSFDLMSEKIEAYCKLPEKSFINAYWYEPDTLMHKHGPGSPQVKDEMLRIDKIIGEMYDHLKDTLIIITADHGQVIIEEEIFLDDKPELLQCLLIPPSIENRASSLFVKPQYYHEFPHRFEEIFGNDYILLDREQVYEMKLFGPGRQHPKVDDFLGDYLACATGRKMLRYIGAHNRERYYFKGHHAGLTEEEMIVPLILASC